MKIETIKYEDYVQSIPNVGRHILAQQRDGYVLVYQAYKESIANYALENQKFGGTDYSYSRMSWIKPNFLWMMYRCGWAQKEGQTRVLGIWIHQDAFEEILNESVFSSYQDDIYNSRETWRDQLGAHEVRLQWDPDHDPHGVKQERKAIQLGIKGKLLKKFGTSMIHKIVDVTEFVHSGLEAINNGDLSNLVVPVESIYTPSNEKIKSRIGLLKLNSV